MYDLHKIIIMGNYSLDNKYEIETVVMETFGMRINSILYINALGSISLEKSKLKDEIKSELYDDMYDNDNLKIKVKEAINGADCMNKVSDFINKIWDNDALVYYYEPNDKCYTYLANCLLNKNSDIYLERYHNIFNDREDTDNDIYTIMENNNMKIQNLIKENKISMVYFLSGLVEKLFSK